jgi:D-sedoheptulose 7-phosphate isomerase
LLQCDTLSPMPATDLIAFERVAELGRRLRAENKRIVSTNGCFDVLHPGHVSFLQQAAREGDVLVVGLNSDASVRKLKGAARPLLGQAARAQMLLELRSVDFVTVFDDDLPIAFLEALQPHVHCKAGDYSADTLPEREAVERSGGVIRILPLALGYSSSSLIEARNADAPVPNAQSAIVRQQLLDGANALRQSAYTLSDRVAELAQQIVAALPKSKILLCGNGGSAADAQHVAAELVARFTRERAAIPAIALTTDSSILTAIANDYSFERIFERQVEALGAAGDTLIAISTSGKSPNVVRAAQLAKRLSLRVVALTGEAASPLSALADVWLPAPSRETAQIQQVHISVLHALCDQIEAAWLVAHP